MTIKQALIQLSQIQSYYEEQDMNSYLKLIRIHTKYSIAMIMSYIGQQQEFDEYSRLVLLDIIDLYGDNNRKVSKLRELMAQ